MEQETGYQRWFRKLVESDLKIEKIISFDNRKDFSGKLESKILLILIVILKGQKKV